MADFGYRIIREGGDAILAVDTRTVSKGRGSVMVAGFGVLGLCFLLIAVTSKNDAVLGTAIFLVGEFCAAGTLYAMTRVVVRNIVFTPDALLAYGDQGRRSFDLQQVERFFASRETLMMEYGGEAVAVMRRLPSAARVEAQVSRLLKEYRAQR